MKFSGKKQKTKNKLDWKPTKYLRKGYCQGNPKTSHPPLSRFCNLLTSLRGTCIAISVQSHEGQPYLQFTSFGTMKKYQQKPIRQNQWPRGMMDKRDPSREQIDL